MPGRLIGFSESIPFPLASSFDLFGHCYFSPIARNHAGTTLASSFGLFGHCYPPAGKLLHHPQIPCIVIWFVRSLLRTPNRAAIFRSDSLHRHLVCSVTVTRYLVQRTSHRFGSCIVIWFVRSLLRELLCHRPTFVSVPCIVIWFVRSLLRWLRMKLLHSASNLASSFGLFGHCYSKDWNTMFALSVLHRHLVCSVTVTTTTANI